MSRPAFFLKLKVKLTAALGLAVVLAVLLFLALQTVGWKVIDHYFGQPSFIAQQNQKTAAQLSDYVAKNGLSIHDGKRLDAWVSQKKYLNIYLYQDRQMIYSSNGYDIQSGTQSIDSFVSDNVLFPISFADADAQVFVESYSEYEYYTMTTFVSLALAFALFLLAVVLLIHVKTSYIEVLEKEIKILEGGNLEHPITIRGKDELSSLAQSVNEMRKSFIERLENEDSARQANNELVTAMSHDLRTPLTALIGYLDIIQYRKYKTEEQLFKYVANSKDNAYRIKDLSDQLFEYFLLSYSQNDLPELEEYDGPPLLDQLIGTHTPLLIDEGFQFRFVPCEQPFTLPVHVMSMQRVFDNLFSNLLKYADKSEPISIRCMLHKERLCIQFANAVKPHSDRTDSNGIGTKVCEKIVLNHGGSFEVFQTAESYSVRICLPANLKA